MLLMAGTKNQTHFRKKEKSTPWAQKKLNKVFQSQKPIGLNVFTIDGKSQKGGEKEMKMGLFINAEGKT